MVRPFRRWPLFFMLSILSFKGRADVMNLNEFMPLRLEDASVLETGKSEAQVSSRWEDEQERFRHRPNLRWGAVKRVQVEFSQDIFSGPENSENGSGQTMIDAQWKFNDQDNLVPAMSLEPQLTFPSGKGTEGIDPSLRLNLTNTIGGTLDYPLGQVHLNYRWEHNSQRRHRESKVGQLLLFGYSHRLGSRSALVTDFSHELETRSKESRNLWEVGWIHQGDDNWKFGLSSGLDLARGYFSGTLAIQLGF